jgi:hypothetical protein
MADRDEGGEGVNPANEHIRTMIVQTLRQILAEDTVIEVPQGVAILSTDGRHTLIRIDDAFLEVSR